MSRDVISTLVALGANVNHQNYRGHTALSLAAEHGDCDLISLLLSVGADPKTKVRDNVDHLISSFLQLILELAWLFTSHDGCNTRAQPPGHVAPRLLDVIHMVKTYQEMKTVY